MQFYKHALFFLALLAISLATLTGCGGSGGGNVTPATPVFTSVPVTAAVESSAYSYTVAAAAADGSPVSYALTTAPTGATLSGDTISWTPTPTQSRKGNSFAVTATSGAGGSATQSWTVSPNGTVQVTDAITSWGTGGATALPPISWSATYPAASVLVPQTDGQMVAIYGTGGSNGVLSFQNVPAGYFWLSINVLYYWTSSSNIDFGTDVSEANTSTFLPNGSSTTFNLNFTGLDSTANPSLLGFDTVPSSIGLEATVQDETSFSWSDAPTSSTTTTTGTTTSLTLQADVSQIQNGFAIQQEPTNLGPLAGYVLGPAAELSGLSLQNNTTDTINVNLTPSPQVSLPLEIDASQWTPLFSNAAPSAPTQTSSPFSLWVQPYITGPNVPTIVASPTSESTACTPTITPGPCEPIPPTIWTFSGPLPLGLFWPAPVTITTSVFPSFALPGPPICSSGLSETITYTGPDYCGGTSTSTCVENATPVAPLLSSDTDFGTIQYGDPFPATWNRVFQFCQQAAMPLPGLSSTTTIDSQGDTQTITYSYNLINSQATTPPSSPVVPLLSPVVNPTINGASLFTPATLDTRAVTLSWSAPALGKPYGYRVLAVPLPQIITSGTVAVPNAVSRNLLTAQTSVTIPPELLTSGVTYLFDIAALMDAKANVETSPRRSGLPTAAANVVSAPITISPSAP
jgi:hypothetical protein